MGLPDGLPLMASTRVVESLHRLKRIPSSEQNHAGRPFPNSCCADGATGAAAVPIAGSVRAKATFFQEQAKKATVAESGVGRRPAGGAGTGAQSGGFSNKAGPGAR